MTRITQGAFTGGILGEGMYARSDTDKFQRGLRDAKNVFVRTQGGVSNRAGFVSISTHGKDVADDPQYLIPFDYGVDQTYMLEFQEAFFRVMRDGAYVLDSSVGEIGVTGIIPGHVTTLTFASTADASQFAVGNFAYFTDPNGTHKLNEAILEVRTVTGNQITVSIRADEDLDTGVGDWGTVGAGAKLELVYQSAHGYFLQHVPDIRFAQDSDTIYLAHPLYPPRKLGRVANDDWLMETINFAITTSVPTNLTASATTGPDVDPAALIDYEYAVSVVLEDTFEEGLISTPVIIANDLAFRGSVNSLDWTGVPEATRYNVYRKSAGAFGYIGTTSSTQFDDANITPNTALGPRIERNPFAAAGDYPSIVAFYEQRLAYGATLNDPQVCEFSRQDNPENFTTSYPQQADDAFRFRMRSQRVNAIRAFVPHTAFGIMTSGGEWEIAPQGDGAYQRPDNRRLSPTTYHGAFDIEPILIGSTALFVEPSGNVVRDMQLVNTGTPPGDLTVLSRDLFEDRQITSWWYSQSPQGLLWVTLDDGSLLTMTYVPEHDVWAWTRQELGGSDVFVHQVSGIREGARDRVYIVVSRDVAGTRGTFTERLAIRNDTDVVRGFYVDGGLQFEYDTPASIITGLHQIAGQPVVALVDGDVVDNLTVDETGTVDLGDRSGQVISVGLPYEAVIQTLDVQLELQDLGSTEGRYKSVSEVAVKLRRSRGVDVGMHLDRMEELQEWRDFLVGGPIPLQTHTPLFTVDGDWVRDATMYVRQKHPLPMTVLGIAPEWQFGG